MCGVDLDYHRSCPPRDKPHTLISKGGPVQGQDQIDVTISGFASRVSRDLKTHVGKRDCDANMGSARCAREALRADMPPA